MAAKQSTTKKVTTKQTAAKKTEAKKASTKQTSAKTKPAKARKKTKVKMSGLDAAAKVLSKAGEPMRCKEIVETMIAEGYWKTAGQTPSATIYAAMLREIQKKGKDARFKKTRMLASGCEYGVARYIMPAAPVRLKCVRLSVR